jgi:hypothetical protein
MRHFLIFIIFAFVGSTADAQTSTDWFKEIDVAGFTNANQLSLISGNVQPGLNKQYYQCLSYTGYKWGNPMGAAQIDAIKNHLLPEDNWISVEPHGVTWTIVNMDYVIQYKPLGGKTGYIVSVLGLGIGGYGQLNVTDADALRKLEHYLSIPPP